MAVFVPTGVITSPAQLEHGKRAVAACLHPRRCTAFIVAGQVVDEVDTRDGSLVYRIVTDLAEPIVRVAVSVGARGHEYLLLLSAANELRVWDAEGRFHLASVHLGAGTGISLLAPTAFHDHCVLFFSRAGSPLVEALHLQRQLVVPGSPALVASLAPRSVSGKAPVTALVTHSTLPLVAAATADGIVSVFVVPLLQAPPALPATAAPLPSNLLGGSGTPASPSPLTAPESPPLLLFAASLNPDLTPVSGALRLVGASGAGAPPSAPMPGAGLPEWQHAVTVLAFHPSLPLLAGVNGAGSVCVWRVGLDDGLHAVIASRAFCVPGCADGQGRIATSLVFSSSSSRFYLSAYAPEAPHLPPTITDWCTGHSTLPPLANPISPALASLLCSGSSDPISTTLAHLTQPPALLSRPHARGSSHPIVWVGGRLICVAEVARVCSNIGVAGIEALDSDSDSLWSTAADSSMLTPGVPHDGSGIVEGPVCDVISAPRSWFITGGEGEGADTRRRDDSDTVKDAASGVASTLFDLSCGSLAEFAARLVSSSAETAAASTCVIAPAAVGYGGGGVGLPPRTPVKSIPHLLETVIYIQSRVKAVGAPNPRRAVSHSLWARHLAAPASVDAPLGLPSGGRRISDLPSCGLCGPITPLSTQRSPSGLYFLVRFAYSSDAIPSQPSRLHSARSSTVAVDESMLYCIVGPLTGTHSNHTTPVSPLLSAVDCVFLSGDRFLTVRNSLTSSNQQVACLTIESLDAVTSRNIDGLAVVNSSLASSGFKWHERLRSGLRSKERSKHSAAEVTPPFSLCFSLHDAIERVFVTPFYQPMTSPESMSANDVLLFVTSWAPTSHDTYKVPLLCEKRQMLRYSNNAFGPYNANNPHAFAVVDAYMSSAGDKSATSHTAMAVRVGEGHSAGATVDNSAAIEEAEAAACGPEFDPRDAWAEHVSSSTRCPLSIRPSFVLLPGECVIKASWQASDIVWGDGGTHAGGDNPDFFPPPLTLPAAIASGGPLLSLLTSHRLLLLLPSLQCVAAVPVMVPLRSLSSGGSGVDCANFGVSQQNPDSVVQMGGGYVVVVPDDDPPLLPHTHTVVPDDDPSPSVSPLFGLVTTGLPHDSSSSYLGGILTSTVASAAAAGARLTSPLPASRLSDVMAADHVSSAAIDLASHSPWCSPITGHVWAGPSLVFATATGEVWSLTPCGNVRRLAALEHWVCDCTPLAVLSDRLIFAATHWLTGRMQVRTRALLPLEPLVTGALDHAAIRPELSLSLLGLPAGNIKHELTPHPVVIALAHTLRVALFLYTPVSLSAAHSSARHVTLSGQGAIAGLALAALARDYSFVRDVVVRYGHPSSSPHGVSRATTASLEQHGLCDLASFLAHSQKPSPDGSDNFGVRRLCFTMPWHIRLSLGMKRGRDDQALWALLEEDPELSAAVMSLAQTADASEHESLTLRLPAPHASLAARLRAFSAACLSIGSLRLALLASDIAGDHAQTQRILVVAGAAEIQHSLHEKCPEIISRLLPAKRIDAALSALVDGHRDRNATSSLAAALLSKSFCENAFAAGDKSENPSSMLEIVSGGSGAVYAAQLASGRSNRLSDSALLAIDYSFSTQAHITSKLHLPSQFSPLLNSALLHALQRYREAVSTFAASGVLRNGGLLFCGGGVDAALPLPLPSPFAPLLSDSLQRFLGSAHPAASQSGRAQEYVSGKEDEDEEGTGGGLDSLLAVGAPDADLIAGGGGSNDPLSFASLAILGKKRLRPLARGLEDAVVGYWRFEKNDEDVTVSKAGHESLSIGPITDLSRQAAHGSLFDSPSLLTCMGGTSKADGTTEKGIASEASLLRIAFAPCDAPFDPGDAKKTKVPRVLVFGLGDASVMPLARELVAARSDTTDEASTSPTPTVSPLMQLCASVCSWGALIPLRRFGYCDVGLRPWDPVTASWTLEMWAKVGSPHPTQGTVGLAERDYDDVDDSSKSAEIFPRNLTLAARMERIALNTSASALSCAAILQWTLSVQSDGSLLFTAFPCTEHGELSTSPTTTSVTSAPRCIPHGEWRHIAVVVDGSEASRETAVRLRTPVPSGHTNLPPASVRLFVSGELVMEGTVPCAAPLPILDDDVPSSTRALAPPGSDGHSCDALLLGPDFVGRLGEVRLWARKRSGDELSDAKDFHLDLAESKKGRLGGGGMAINIKQSVGVPAAGTDRSPTGIASVPIKRLGGLPPLPSRHSIHTDPTLADTGKVSVASASGVAPSSAESTITGSAPQATAAGGLSAPPPGVGGGKKAALMRARQK